MEDLLIAASIGVVLAIPVTIIVLLVWVSRLSRRVKALETGHAVPAQPPTLDAEAASPAPDPAKPAAAAIDSPWETAGPAEDPQAESPPPAPPAPPEPDFSDTPPRAIVMRADKAAALALWLKGNWIYVVSAVSLALAGIFLVQYGIENGYLPPMARVIAALAFGAALVAAGEYIRRRWGDDEDSPTAYLPSIFSGAGIITLFAAVLAALHFYALIGPVTALIGLVLVAALSVILGWFSGPLLAAVGITGAMVAPFLVGGESDAPEMFYGYFALLATVGLGIDAVRRWAWVTVLTLMLAYGCGWFLYLQIGRPEWMMALAAGLVLGAMAIPPLRLWPVQGGAAVIESFAKGLPRGWPEFPTRVAAAAMLVSVAMLAVLSKQDAGSFWLSLALLALLFAGVAIWARGAPALEDLAILPGLGLLAVPVPQAMDYGPVYQAFQAFIDSEPGTTMPKTPFYLAGLAALISLIAAWRSLSGARWPVAWAAGAALTAPLMMVGLEVFWEPADVIGAYPWALAAAALACIMGLLAGRFAQVDGDDRARVALGTLAALSMIAFALILILSETALTLALALTVLAAAALDRRFDLRAMMWFVALGVVVLGWRLVLDPGVDWASNAAYPDLIAGYGGSIAILIATLVLLRSRTRVRAIIMVESAIWTLAAVFATVLVFRLLDDAGGSGWSDSHWGTSLAALVWLISAANQLWRTQIAGYGRRVRIGLASIFALLGGLGMAASVVFLNPLTNGGEPVLGPPVFDSLLVAYLLPALLFAFVAWKFTFVSRRWRGVLVALAAAFAAAYVGLEIRHIWRGADLSVHGTSQPELYSYTIAMLLTGAGLLYQAIATGSVLLRRVAMAVIALTVAKVFLMDISGLKGLMRVFSFLALGLVLAGLALLNRWAAAQQREARDGDGDDGD